MLDTVFLLFRFSVC